MTFHRRFRTAAAVAAVAVATTFGAGMAMAQPHGPHGHPGGGGVEIGWLIGHAKDKLNLNTSQQGMFDKAVADSQAARDAGRALHDRVKATLTTELAKAEPDLAAVAAAADAAADQARAQRIAIRNEWLALYATFSPDQKAVVKEGIQKHMARAESFREKMREHFQQRSNGKAAT
jgi:Spy/CpxP family protein refolding chaperone